MNNNNIIRPDQKYAISLLNVDYIDMEGSFVDEERMYLNIDKNKIPTPRWILKENPKDLFMYVFAMNIMFDDYLEWIPKDEWINEYDPKYYIIYEINSSDETEKINQFSIEYKGKMYSKHGADYLRAVLDISNIKEHVDAKILQDTYDKFIIDIENLILEIIQKKEKITGNIIAKALYNDECCFIEKFKNKNLVKSVPKWQKRFCKS